MINSLYKKTILLIIICIVFSTINTAFGKDHYLSKRLSHQIHRYNIADKIIESLYDVKGNFVGLSEKESKQLTPKNYLNKSLKRSKQFANEILCLRKLFYNFNLSEISKAEARKRVNEITEDVIKYQQGIYQKIIIEKVCLDSQNWHYMSNSMDEIRSTTNTIRENLKKIRTIR